MDSHSRQGTYGIRTMRGATAYHESLSSADVEDGLRRKRLRKGTHSCWECKRRKMRCVRESTVEGQVCEGCHERGSKCVTQDLPEQSSKTQRQSEVKQRNAISNFKQFPARTSNRASTPIQQLITPDLDQSETSVRDSSIPDNIESISENLHRALPSCEDIQKIHEVLSKYPMFDHSILSLPYSRHSQDRDSQLDALLQAPRVWMHPVLVAKYMVLLATLLQELPTDNLEELQSLAESPQTLSNRLALYSISNITCKDEMFGSVDFLECLMLESVYHADLGDLRRSWLVNRKALSMAQLMGLNLPNNHAKYEILDPRVQHNPRDIWNRVVFTDRVLSLLLGLSDDGVGQPVWQLVDLSMDDPLERLESVHCAIATLIIGWSGSTHSAQYLDLIRTIDTELCKAADDLPGTWWSLPKLDRTVSDARQLSYDTGRALVQIWHYNLLNQLHLPYATYARPAAPGRVISMLTCATASRDILTRFIALRSVSHGMVGSRMLNYIALMAAISLLLVHLESQSSDDGRALIHVYRSDRSMIQAARDSILPDRTPARGPPSVLFSEAIDLLQNLLAIDPEHGSEHLCSTSKVKVYKTNADGAQGCEDGDMSVHIPYFGYIRIER